MYYKGRNDDRAEKLVGKANYPDHGDSAAVKARTTGNLTYYTTPGNPGKDPQWADTTTYEKPWRTRRPRNFREMLDDFESESPEFGDIGMVDGDWTAWKFRPDR